MVHEIKAGFVDGNLKYEMWVRTSDITNVYQQRMEDGFQVEVYNRYNANFLSRVVGKQLFFASTGTTGKNRSRLFKWSVHLHPLGVPSDEWHTICRDADGDLNFYDGEYNLYDEALKKKEKENAQKMQEVERVLAMAIEQNSSTYALIGDKGFFEEQMRSDIELSLFDCGSKVKSVLASSGESFENFLRSERELPAFINALTCEMVLKEYPDITKYDLPQEKIKSIINDAIYEIVTEKRWGFTIEEYRQIVYQDIEDRVSGYLQDIRRKEEEKRKEVIKEKYPLEKLMELYAPKISECVCVENAKKAILRVIEDLMRWGMSMDEEEFLRDVEKAIDKGIIEEKRQLEMDAFVQLWGSDVKFIELTQEKKEAFSLIESGGVVDEYTMHEHELYQKLLTQYEDWVTNKKTKKIKPTFAAIPAYFEHFLKIAEIARKANLIDEQGVFVGWEGFNKFKRGVRAYEKTLLLAQ